MTPSELGRAEVHQKRQSLVRRVSRCCGGRLKHFSLQLIPKQRISVSSEYMCCYRKHLLANHEDHLKVL